MSEPDSAATVRAPAVSVIRTEELFGSRREIVIKHRETEYRLRITKTDKLILTK